MPYIKQEDRPKYETPIAVIINELEKLDDNDIKGHLNYIFSSILKKLLIKKGLRYFRINDFIGVLECAKLELYRKIAGNYEDQAIDKNGDI